MADKVDEAPVLLPDATALSLELSRLLPLIAFRVNRNISEVVATAALPAAGGLDDGSIVVEDTGTGLNLVVYAKGQRFRFTGTAF
jgi:hypothetical protein